MFAVKDLSIEHNKIIRLKIDDFSCEMSDFVGVVGPNGAGKSTLLKVLGGLLNASTKGCIRLNNIPLESLSRRQIAKQVAYVPQETEMTAAFTVKEVVSLGRNPYWPRLTAHYGEKSWNDQDRFHIEGAIETMDIQALQDRTVDTLSGGERQRVLVARALAQNTPAMLLDEPIANLDVHHQLELLQLLQREAHAGRVIMCALHDLSLASRFCNRLAVLTEGHLVENGDPQDLLSADFFEKHFKLKAIVQSSPHFSGSWVLPLEPL